MSELIQNQVKSKQSVIVKSQTEIAPDIYDIWMETTMAQYAKAGQFVSVYPHDKSTLLPRPISICEVDRNQNRMRLVYRVQGSGTREFSSYQEGDKIDILGNLGNGFPIEETRGKKVMLIAGGIGIPPMIQAAKDTLGEVVFVVGYRDSALFLKEDMEQYGEVVVATEDRSAGIKGNVMDAIKAENLYADLIFSCGPMPMLKAVKQYAQEKNIPAYISLEERMACGVGACLGCVCKTKEVDHHSHVHNTRICADGPVFDAKEVEI